MTAVSSINVVVGLCIDDNRILVTQRPADTHLGLKWEFPGGKPEAGEDDATALAREFREEVGLTIRVGRLFHQISFDYPERRVHLRFYLAAAENPQALQLHQVVAARWLPWSRLVDDDFPAANRALLALLRAQQPRFST